MSHRPLVFVSGLTFGDYLLWNWSLNGNHDVLALVSGLTLPPLAVACLWLLALSLARLLARTARVAPVGRLRATRPTAGRAAHGGRARTHRAAAHQRAAGRLGRRALRASSRPEPTPLAPVSDRRRRLLPRSTRVRRRARRGSSSC